MGKRLYRINAVDLPENVTGLYGLKLNIILSDGSTLFGSIVSHKDSIIRMKDLTSHCYDIPMTRIREVVYDQEAER